VQIYRGQAKRGIAHITNSLLIGLSLILVFCSLVYSESENYCHDEKSWAEWDQIIAKNPNDMEIQALHALRIGLCAKVDRGEITLEQATEIFKSARGAIVQMMRGFESMFKAQGRSLEDPALRSRQLLETGRAGKRLERHCRAAATH